MAEEKTFDVVIVGAGPAGLACGQYSSRAGRKTVLIEEMAPGGQTMIIDEIENYPGLEKISGYELASKFEQQATGFGCQIAYGTVNAIERLEDGSFKLDTTDGIYLSPVVVIATGSKHRNLEVPGENKLTCHEVSYCSNCDVPI
ncbi:MAG: NAD(P)/FAD-dependent oxidoreductase, partial [Spirochaetales bacterium]|nr:NAD(P)/FAD-dependent oxidoreductase [Spirochaetales bacterium]